MNRSKKGKNGKLFRKKSHSSSRLECTIAIIVLIPTLFGVYLCYQQINTQNNNEPQTDVSFQIPLGKDLGTAVSLVPQRERIIRHSGYTISYNKDLRIPNWTSCELTREETKEKEKGGNRFIADPLVTGPVATNAGYTRSGYDKGYMAPAADIKWSPEAMKESFCFSNMCPQRPRLSRREWKGLEEKIQDWAIADSAIIIICGPIIEKHPKTVGKDKVIVPQKLFKIVLSPFIRPMQAIGFLFNDEQAVEPLSSYTIAIDSIESLTNMDFFTPLPDEIEDKVEADVSYSLWPN